MTDYTMLQKQMETLLRGEHDFIANMANFCALIYNSLTTINWAGFYRLVDGELLLGPFQGRAACMHIPLGSGACGTALQREEALIVSDVDKFPGHITCDAASKSEIVLPIWDDKKQIIGVFDVDSPLIDRFTIADEEGLGALLEIFTKNTQFEGTR